MLIVTLAVILIKNLVIMVYSFKKYYKNWQNIFEIVLLINSMIYASLYITNSEKSAPPRAHFASIAIFGSWGNLTLILGKVPALGIYILMITGVTKELLIFLSIYSTSLVGFALAFHVLCGFSHGQLFGDPLSSLITTLVMMVGEINYADLIDKVCKKYEEKLVNHSLNLSIL